MSIEKKQFYSGGKSKEVRELRESFGWKYVGDAYVGRGGAYHLVMERDTEMNNYSDLVALENKYDSLEKQLKYYSPIIDTPEAFLLILLFVFPFVIYCIYKNDQKKKYAAHNASIKKQMNDVLSKAKALL